MAGTETSMGRRPLLVVQHAAWEGPHRILGHFAESAVLERNVIDQGGQLPPVSEVSGAVFMGGPMSANDTDRLPALGQEITWLDDAVRTELPVLGICLGSQLLARALGGTVRPAPVTAIGWAPVAVHAPTDALVGHLAPSSTVLHWHGELFDPPPGATVLASSSHVACQAFRAGRRAWGLLFHPEADISLVDRWLAEPAMRADAEDILGPTAVHQLRSGARQAAADDLDARSGALFAAFAARCRSHTAAGGPGD